MKKPGYIERMAAFVRARTNMPLAWGTNDCVTMVADAALLTCGVDHLGALRGQWATEAEANAILEANGGLMAAFDARFPRIAVANAGRGDIVLTNVDGVVAVATIFGMHAFGPGPDGIVWTPAMKYGRVAWEV